jgi:hypothetical protein
VSGSVTGGRLRKLSLPSKLLLLVVEHQSNFIYQLKKFLWVLFNAGLLAQRHKLLFVVNRHDRLGKGMTRIVAAHRPTVNPVFCESDRRSYPTVTVSEFNELQRRMDDTLAKLSTTKDPKLRLQLLMHLRLLLKEAEHAIASSADEGQAVR